MPNKKTQAISFYILLGVIALIVLLMVWPFWELLAFAFILAILFHPLYQRLAAESHSPNFSAGLTVLIIAAIIAGPVFFIGQQVFFELADLYHRLSASSWANSSNSVLAHLPPALQQLGVNFNSDIQGWLSRFTSQAFSSLAGILSSIGWLIGSLVVIAFSVFFLLRDWDKIKAALIDMLPLSEANENVLFERLGTAISGVVKGQFLVVLTISLASFVGFSIFNLPNALLWSCVMFLAAFVPTFGTSLVWAPAVIYLYVTAHGGAALGLAIWAGASVALIDNVLAAKLVSSRVRLHPLLTIFAILGGVLSFGVLGVLLGPIFMAILIALLEIYRTGLKK